MSGYLIKTESRLKLGCEVLCLILSNYKIHTEIMETVQIVRTLEHSYCTILVILLVDALFPNGFDSTYTQYVLQHVLK